MNAYWRSCREVCGRSFVCKVLIASGNSYEVNMLLLRAWLLRYTFMPVYRAQINDCCDGHILQIYTNRSPCGLVID